MIPRYMRVRRLRLSNRWDGNVVLAYIFRHFYGSNL